MLVSECRVYRLDNEGACSDLAAGDDVGYLEYGHRALYRKYELKRHYRSYAREYDVPKALPRVCAVEVCGFVDVGRNGLYRAYVHNDVKSDVTPYRREHETPVDDIGIGQPLHRVAAEHLDYTIERTLGVGDAVALLEEAAEDE